MPSLRAKLSMLGDLFNKKFQNRKEGSTVSSSNQVDSNTVNILPCLYQLAYLTETLTSSFTLLLVSNTLS